MKKDTQIDSIHHNKPKHDKSQRRGHGQPHRSNSGKQGPKTGRNCHNCGSKHPPRKCPAYGKECHYCKKKGHYSKCCHTRAHSQSSQCKSRKELNNMEQEPYGLGQYFEFEKDGINVIHCGNSVKEFKGNSNVLFDEIDGLNQRILTDLCVQGASNFKDCNSVSSKCQGPVMKCRFKVDSGAAGNLIPYNVFQELYPGMPKSALKNSINHRTHLVAYNKEEIKQLGTCILKVIYGGKTLTCEFFVVSSKFKPIIGFDASCNLELLTINCPTNHSWTRDTRNTPIDTLSSSFDAISDADADIPEKISKEWIVNNPKCKHLFHGIGRFKCDPVQIKITHNSIPVQKPPRRVPLALKDHFKQELDNMASQGILSKLDDTNVNVPEWLNSFVVVKKPNGKLHICLDPTDLNPDIVRPVCNARTLDEVITLLKDAVHFAVFDSTKGLFHVPLDEASKLLTAMLTPVGIYTYNVLAMGLSNATDIFESCICQILEGLNGTINVADDVLVYGCDYNSFKSNVIGFLDRCVEKDFHLNPDKIRINVPNVPFFGQILTKEGLKPDPHKVDVIQQWPTPTCVTELQSFHGSVNYLRKFIPYLSDLRQPLQELLKSNNEFYWTQVHEKAFNQLKEAIVKNVTLQFFNQDLPLYIEVDASKKGIGAIMLQPDKNTKNTACTDTKQLMTSCLCI